MNKEACNKAPGRDGICMEFFKVNRDSVKHDMLAVFNQIFLDGRIMEQQKLGIVVCIPKTDIPTTPADCRPITLLNADYKVLARITGNRLRPTLSEVLHQIQHCGVPGSKIFDAVAKVRDAIACTELTHTHPSMYPFFGLHRSFWHNRAYISISDVKELWIYVVGSKSFRSDQLFKVTQIKQLCYFST